MGMQDRDWYRQELKEKRQRETAANRAEPQKEPVKKTIRFELSTPIFVVLVGAMLLALMLL